LLTSISQAAPADELVSLIQTDPAAAKKKYSRSIGLSEGYFYFLRGEGKILSVSDDEVIIAVTGGGTRAEVSLQAGLIFGNAVRDGTGLLSANDYPNSQDFNDISAALNHLVETSVQPTLRAQAKVGARISFAGCAEVNDEAADLKPLKVIPLQTQSE
jgi:predicted lipoprotein